MNREHTFEQIWNFLIGNTPTLGEAVEREALVRVAPVSPWREQEDRRLAVRRQA